MKSSNQLCKDLTQAQKKLADFLGNEINEYYSLLKSWFRGNLSKNEFDLQARNIIPHESIHLHNNFLLSLLTKCGSFDSSLEGKGGRVRKKFKKSHEDENNDIIMPEVEESTSFQQFIPAEPLSTIPQVPNHAIPLKFREFSSKLSLSLIPTQPLIHCRLFVAAWERGIEEVTDECVDLLYQAVIIFVKNIFQALVTHKYGFQIMKSHPKSSAVSLDNFVHLIGSVYPTFSLMPNITTSSTTPTIGSEDEVVPSYMHHEASKALSQPSHISHEVNLFDLLELLQTKKKVIASRSLCRITEERIIHKLYHPSQELITVEKAVKRAI